MRIWIGGLMLVGTTKVWAPPRLTTETRPDSHNGPIFPFLQELQKFRACALANIIKQASVSKFSRNEKKGESSCYVLRPHIIEPTPTGILSRNTLADQHHDNHCDDHHQIINLMMTIITMNHESWIRSTWLCITIITIIMLFFDMFFAAGKLNHCKTKDPDDLHQQTICSIVWREEPPPLQQGVVNKLRQGCRGQSNHGCSDWGEGGGGQWGI